MDRLANELPSWAADRGYDDVLGPEERLVERPFTDPQKTLGDVLVMNEMLVLERALVRTWSRGVPGPGISQRTEAGSRQLLAVPDGDALLDAANVTAVGFFGELRARVDHAVLFELERQVAATFPEYAKFGFLSYLDVGPEHGRYGNLILFRGPGVPEEWHANPAHSNALTAAPQHYDHIRLHEGWISGPLLGSAELEITRTLYLDFRGGRSWRALRLYKHGAQVQGLAGEVNSGGGEG